MWYALMSLHAIQSVVQCWAYDYSMLSRIYVSVNAFRSLFPVRIVERECFTSISSPFMDRSLATVAELCFAKQLATHFHDDILFYYAFIAQLSCWLGMITQNNLFHVYEEYFWLLMGFTCFWNAKNRKVQWVAGAYCIYMMTVDIPMYMVRFIQQEKQPPTQDMFHCELISDLKDEYLWRTGYFVGASRLSMLS